MTFLEGAQKAAALALALGVLEVVLRLAYASPSVARRLTTNDDLSYRRAWVERQRASSDPLERIDAFDPLLGWRPRPNLKVSSIWNGKTLTTNAQGFRSARDYAVGKPPSMTRLLALGDSFTFGEEVSDDETWTHYLDEMCPRVEVFNLGVHGYGHDQMLLLLRETAREYDPDIVLLGYLKTDMYRNLLSFRDYAKPRFRLAGGELALVDVPVPTPEELLKNDRWRPRLVDFGLHLVSRLENLVGIRSFRKRTMTAALLKELARVSLRMGARPVFAYFPAGSEFQSVAENRENEAFFWEVCSGTEGLSCMSVSEALLEASSTEDGCCEVPGGYHWNARAHLLAAQSLLHSLQEKGSFEGCSEPSETGPATGSALPRL